MVCAVSLRRDKLLVLFIHLASLCFCCAVAEPPFYSKQREFFFLHDRYKFFKPTRLASGFFGQEKGPMQSIESSTATQKRVLIIWTMLSYRFGTSWKAWSQLSSNIAVWNKKRGKILFHYKLPLCVLVFLTAIILLHLVWNCNRKRIRNLQNAWQQNYRSCIKSFRN